MDDLVLSRQSLTLLDNITNLQRSTLNYLEHNFNYDELELPKSYNLLVKLRHHILLRLPSCSMDDESNYFAYLHRLRNCLWRRWSIHMFELDDVKMDPLELNWNKEDDLNLLYGPDLRYDEVSIAAEIISEHRREARKYGCAYVSYDHDHDEGEDSDSSLSGVSEDFSIFDSASRCGSPQSCLSPWLTSCMSRATAGTGSTTSGNKRRSLKFCDIVSRRDISLDGGIFDINIMINDTRYNKYIPSGLTQSGSGSVYGYGYNYGYNYVKYNDELAFDDDYDKLAYSYNHDYEGCQFDNCNKYDCDHEYDYSCPYFYYTQEQPDESCYTYGSSPVTLPIEV